MELMDGWVGAPSTPSGARRRPFTKTNVRPGPSPLKLIVSEPGPLSVTKPAKDESI